MKIEKLQPGMVVYDIQRRGMGNTTMKTTSVFSVYIREVCASGRRVLASWNGNPPSWFYGRAVSKWREKKPVLIHSISGSSRLATREELKQIKEGTFQGRHS